MTRIRLSERVVSPTATTTAGLLLALLVPFLIYVSVVESMMKWDEIRWVPDDYCYLRQAKLFQDKGLLNGFDTHLESETVQYLAAKSRELGLGRLSGYGFANPPCHYFIDATNKLAMQYPPGTGLLLSLFPEGWQVRALSIAGATIVLLITLGAILIARTASALALLALLGSATLYLTINPSKGSHSMAPTMPICIVLALLTVLMLEAKRLQARLAAASASGLVLGLSVNIRIANVLLAAGYVAVFVIDFIRTRGREEFLRGALFSISIVLGVLPTLAANAINAGGPFVTPYSAGDLAHDFGWEGVKFRILVYMSGTRGAVVWAAILCIAIFWMMSSRLKLKNARLIAWLVSINLVVNLAYYFTHAALASYYAIPLAILSMWTLCFAYQRSEQNAYPALDRANMAPPALRGVLAATLAGAIAAYVGLVALRMPKEVIEPRPSSFADSSAVVWANLNAGMVLRNLDRYAAWGLANASPEIQDAVIERIARDRRPQLFVNDSPPMQRLIDRAARFGPMTPAGQAFGYEVYKLEPRE
jgi:4-amino-4-deoxy-L-arabinose transferase-like glycosyltransferase